MEIDGRYLVDISGQLVVVDISGQSIVTDISGQTVFAIISGEIQADISGDVIRITSLSGESVIPVSLSGQTVTVDISGQSVVTDISGQSVVVDVSGQTVVTSISGQSVITSISGQSVVTSISGQAVDTFKRALHTTATSNLLAGGAFSGSIVDSINYSTLRGTVFSNKAGDLYIEQSPDGTNWDAEDHISVVANVGKRWSTEIDGRYTLITYKTGTAQSGFRLYAWLTT